MRRLLIANRGEIAVRIQATAHRMGLSTIALEGPGDAGAPHVRVADSVVPVDGYLDPDAVLGAALAAGADAVHPGYGFLSERAEFARMVEAANITFVGPSPEAMDRMGDKLAARAAAEAANVSILPGSPGALPDAEAAEVEAARIGLPVILKAAAGGGGKGMRIVRSADDLWTAVESAAREAETAFGDGRLFVERYLDDPRHIEVQILADGQGTVWALGTRDCSWQRRHQKIIEEAPAPGLPPGITERLCAEAERLAARVGYRSAGTVEFLYGRDGTIAFLEMNTRLQVEHPVTELTTGLDLVEWMIRIARGERLPATPPTPSGGHAVEARLYAEDSRSGFLPSVGTITRLVLPTETPTLRVDSGVAPGVTVGNRYDPMIAKLIGYGPTRDTAIASLQDGLRRIVVDGIGHNGDLLLDLLERPETAPEQLSTNAFGRVYGDRFAPGPADPAEIAASAIKEARRQRAALGEAEADLAVAVDGERVAPGAGDDLPVRGRIPTLTVQENGVDWPVLVAPSALLDMLIEAADTSTTSGLTSPLTGTLVKWLAVAGEEIEIGAPIAQIEAMKMVHTVPADRAGRVSDLLVSAGGSVGSGDIIALLGP